MFKAPIFFISTFIMVRDFKLHLISNRHLVILSLVLLMDMHRAPLLVTAFAILGSITLFSLGGVGMGDIKLAIVLCLSQGAILLQRMYFSWMVIVLALTVITIILKYRELKGSVAFAHVLLLPFLAIYLAI